MRMMETFAGRLGLEPRAVQATGKEVLNVAVRLVAADGVVLHEFPNIRKLRKIGESGTCALHDEAVKSKSHRGVAPAATMPLRDDETAI